MTCFFRRSLLVALLVLCLCVGSVSAAESVADPPADAVTAPVAVSVPDVVLDVHDTVSVPSFSAFADTAVDSIPLLAQTLRELIGTYTPRTQTVTTYYDGQPIAVEEQVIPGLAGLDWEWLASTAVFSMSLYCVFRMIGGILRWT